MSRSVARAREEYAVDPDTFITNHSRQNAAILNIQRACEAALDMGQHFIRVKRLGIPQSSRDVFELLAMDGIIDAPLALAMKNMVGFRNIALHDDQKLQLPIVVAVIKTNLDQMLMFASRILGQNEAKSATE